MWNWIQHSDSIYELTGKYWNFLHEMVIYFKNFQDSHFPLRVSYLLICTRQTPPSKSASGLYETKYPRNNPSVERIDKSALVLHCLKGVARKYRLFDSVSDLRWLQCRSGSNFFLYRNTAPDRIQGAIPFQIHANPDPDPICFTLSIF